MPRQRGPFDKLVDAEVEKLSTRQYFLKRVMKADIIGTPDVQRLLLDLRKNYSSWKLYEMVVRQIDQRISRALCAKDENGFRMYASVVADGERRWMRVRELTASQLRTIVGRLEKQSRALNRAAKPYHVLIEELDATGRPDAKADEVWLKALPRMLQAA